MLSQKREEKRQGSQVESDIAGLIHKALEERAK